MAQSLPLSLRELVPQQTCTSLWIQDLGGTPRAPDISGVSMCCCHLSFCLRVAVSVRITPGSAVLGDHLSRAPVRPGSRPSLQPGPAFTSPGDYAKANLPLQENSKLPTLR